MPTRLHASTRAVLATAAIALCALLAHASAAAQNRFENVERIVAFGDVHGAYDELVTLLRYVDVVDESLEWSGGNTHLVSLGDLLDRGADSRRVMDLIMSLQTQAIAAGGRVHMVLGNHEMMNLTGDLRYVAPGEYAAFAGEETPEQREDGLALIAVAEGAALDESSYPPGFFAHRAAFSAAGIYGSWLLELPSVLVVNDILFAHGGFPLWLNEYSLTEINDRTRQDLRALLEQSAPLIAEAALPAWQDVLDTRVPLPEAHPLQALRTSPFLTDASPMWYRGTAHCHPAIEQTRVAATLGHFDVSRIVLGHSPTTTRTVQARFDGRVLLADTGMLASYYKGQPAGIVFEAGGAAAVYPARELETPTISPPPGDAARLRPTDALLEQLRTMPLPAEAAERAVDVEIEGRKHQVLFQRGNKRLNSSRLAAFRLDRALGFGMVPITVAREHNGKAGTLAVLPASTISELERTDLGLYRPSWCEPLPDYQLMYILDALILNNARTVESMLYDRGNWSLWLLLNDTAFSTGKTFPAHLQQVPAALPRRVADALQALTPTELDALLGDLLSARQIRAVDERRQLLLESWRIEE